MERCSTPPHVVTRTVTKTVQLPPIAIGPTSSTTTTVRRTRPGTDTIYSVDTLRIEARDSTLVRERDSLAKLLVQRGTSVVFSLDTVTAANDRIRVDCYELTRSIGLRLDLADRSVDVTETVVTNRLGIGLFAGGGYDLLRQRPFVGIGAGITLTLIP